MGEWLNDGEGENRDFYLLLIFLTSRRNFSVIFVLSILSQIFPKILGSTDSEALARLYSINFRISIVTFNSYFELLPIN